MSGLLLARSYFDAGLGRYITSPGFGGVAAITAAGVAFWANGRKIEADRQEASRARVQAKRADAYVAIIKTNEQIGHWAQSVQPAIEPADPPQPPELDEQTTATAQVLAFASMQVRQLWDAWWATVQEIRQTDRRIEASRRTMERHVDRTGDAGSNLMSASMQKIDRALDELQQLRARETVQRQGLHDRMNQELREADGPERRRRFGKKAGRNTSS